MAGFYPFGLFQTMTLSLPIARRATKCFVPGAIVIYLFNEGSGTTVYDHSGNGNHATFGAGAAAPTWTPTGLSFDGGDTASLTTIRAKLSAGFTIQVVVKPGADVTNQQGVVSLPYFQVGSLGYINGRYRVGAQGSSTGYYLNASAGSASANTWRDVAVTAVWEGALATYIDGVPDRTGTTAGTLPSTGTHAPAIGSWGASGFPMTGDIAVVLIYPFALTPAQVAQNHAALGALVTPRGIDLPN